MSDICFLDAVEMRSLIRERKLSAREVLAAHLEQIEKTNPRVNAIVTLAAEQAIESASRADESQARGADLGPLHGLPVLHKDLFETAGIRTTFGSPIFKDNVPTRDAIIVERAQRAGAISLGKTNTSEFGAGSQTFNQVFGATRNPYDLSKTCGGSSGGSAVALACGMSPLADGSDNGGSLRNPTAWTSTVGLRPSPGRVPSLAPADPWSTLSVDGPMARTVADVALFLSALAGPDPRSPISIPEPGASFRASLHWDLGGVSAALGRDFRGVRIAWFKDLGGLPFDRRVLRAVNAQRKAFEDLGCIVETAEPDLSGAHEAYQTLRAFGFVAAHSANMRDHRDLLKPAIQAEFERGIKLTAADLARAIATRAQVFERMRQFLKRYAYFIVPSTQVPPFDIDQEFVREIEGVPMENYTDWMRCCYLITATECPSLSVPAGYTPEGLPVGLQIVGRHRADVSVLQLGHAFEQSTRSTRPLPPNRGQAPQSPKS